LALAGLAAGLFAAACLQVVQGLALLRLEGRADAALGAAVMDRLLRLPAGFFRGFSAGDLGQRALAVSTLRQLLGGVIAGTLIPAVTAVSAVGLIALVDPRVAPGALALMAIPVGAALLTAYRQLRDVRGQARRQGELAGLLLELLGGLAKLRVAAAERGAFTRWAAGFAGLRRHALAAREAHGRLATLLAALPMAALAALIAGLGALGGPEPSPAVFLTLVAALTQGLAAAIVLGESALLLTAAAPLAERLEVILQAPPEVAGEAGDPGELSGAIELAHVSFRYEGQAQPVLQDVSLRIAPGEFVAFVGPSGSGKSTLLRLLLGFERPERGAVHYDGRNLAALDVTAVRRQLGVVLQAGRLMPGSLLENIRGGGLLTLDEAWAAARHAGLEDDIRALPMGMHTVIGEGSSTLSGGQRQRLLIARALARQPRILFLDEATSALDNRTQAVVSRSLEQLQCTRLVIAHRLSTVVNADRIHVLAEGRIVQTGTYEELAAQEGLFRELVRRQVA
jgi:ATP-binding cassette subfamily C protein